MSSDNDRALRLLALMLVITVVVVGVSLFLAHRHNREAVQTGELAWRQQLIEELTASLILYVPRQITLPADAPHAPLWADVPSITVPVVAQAVTMPILEQATLDSVQVQAVSDGREIVWRLTWADQTPDMNVDAGRFSDAAAIQFPVTSGASFMMGDYGKRVQILHWKGIWQKDVDEGFQDVQDLHPNYWTDLYWFAEGSFPYRVPESFDRPESRQWFAGFQAGNPLADFERHNPVEELVAEGYGTLTHQAAEVTRGRGAWKDGRWSVLFRRPLVTDDANDYQFSVDARGHMGVAVWEGSAGNVGGRKHWSDWFEFRMQS